MRIGELATTTGVSVRALRYYEEQGLLKAERTASGLHDFLFALQAHDVRFDARHRCSSLGEKQALQVLGFSIRGDGRRAAKIPLPLGGFLREDVALERFGALHLARPCHREALSRSAVAFHFRHNAHSLISA